MVLRVLSAMIGPMPWRVVYALSSGSAWLLSLFYRRGLVTNNLRKAFPGLSAKQRAEVRRSYYRHLSDIAFETLKGANITNEEFLGKVQLTENEDLQMLRQEPGPVLLYAAHTSHWEWMGQAVGLLIGPGYPLYKPLRSPSADAWMLRLRSRNGNRPVPVEQAGRAIRQMSGQGPGWMGVIGDQSPSRGNKGKIWLEFLGVPTPFYKGVFTLPRLTQWPAYYSSMERTTRGHYLLTVKHLASPPYARDDDKALTRYVQIVEGEIRKIPAQWLWTHNRWKYERQQSEEFLIFRK